MPNQKPPAFATRPTAAEIAAMDQQAKDFAPEIAALFDTRALPIPVVLKSLLICYQALAVNQHVRDMETASFFLRRVAEGLLMRSAKADPYGTAPYPQPANPTH